MGWTAHYRVLREKPLGESEIANLETAGKKLLGDQEIWPQVARINGVGAAKVAEDYPHDTLTADPATLAALEAEETAILEQL